MPEIIDGRRLAESIRQEISASIREFYSRYQTRPRLAAVLVGDNPASQVYVRNKVRACEEVGLESETHHLSSATSEAELTALIDQLNASNTIDGILLQLPLPAQIPKMRILDKISPAKDVDGLHPMNVGLLVQGRAELVACTPKGVMEALKRYQIPVAGKDVVVVGRSELVGKPLAQLLMQENATVTVCHSKTKDLPRISSGADIVIAAIGRPAFLTPEFIREGAVVVDVGTTVLKNESDVVKIFGEESKKQKDFIEGKAVLVGDVHPAAYARSSMYTPVPGGVGPLTITMLLKNTVRAAELRRNA
jgi:methylenetetrahydrofolate dehydrogenase (NADP+) / methenyltetrahydrofolate cyclohydrolase